MRYSIRVLMAVMTITAIVLFLWRLAPPIAFFVLSMLPTGLVLLLYRNVASPTNASYRWALILTATVFAYVGSIGPFNMLIGSCVYQYSTVAWINEIGCWIYFPLRALPLSARDALNDNYVSGWINFGSYVANSGNHELHQVPSIPTQLYR